MAHDMSSPTPSDKGFGHGSYTSPIVEKQSSRPDASISKWSSILSVLVAGMALFSDGYNIQIIGYMNSVLTKLYPDVMTTEMKARLNNSILVGDVVGMIFFGSCIDRWGRRLGIFATTFFLVLGIVLATAAHGTTPAGLLWMMVVGRGVAGVGAGGEYSVCTTQAIEAADENPYVQRRRGVLVATSTNSAIVSGFVASSVVSNCTFLVSSESFPTPVRGHFLGFAAAAGKVGAAIGTQVFPLIVDRYEDEVKGQQAIFLIGAAISVVGTLVVYFFIPDRDRQLESEDKLFKEYLEQHGWDTSEMGLR
ncbi:hypothetical protein VKT23_010400 [Stygiomarasmius scandens]|uniref:Major facilitator superfamily (MFS) profile domain-containing protein n=1 Tax=Marasmiellus scandens TaxID=2682957 RepID=A0ABR1JBJ5_9AGAR